MKLMNAYSLCIFDTTLEPDISIRVLLTPVPLTGGCIAVFEALVFRSKEGSCFREAACLITMITFDRSTVRHLTAHGLVTQPNHLVQLLYVKSCPVNLLQGNLSKTATCGQSTGLYREVAAL